jgi:hypothetical protein
MASIKTIARRAWGALGPGLTTGAADDDPSGIATYSQAGAQFGYALTWSMLLTLPFMAAIQLISALIGWHTRRGLAQYRHHAAAMGASPARGASGRSEHRQYRCRSCSHGRGDEPRDWRSGVALRVIFGLGASPPRS